MSHYTCLVILPKDQQPADERDAERAIEPLLAPYDENTGVEPYKRHYDDDEVARMAEHYKIDPADLSALAAKVPDWEGREGGVDDQGLYYLSTYNPKSKWDWYAIGGRWHGDLTEDGRNVFPLTDLASDWSTYAIVTPDGEWHSRGRMGWFACSTDEDDQWDAKRYELASAFPDHVGVLVDLHI